MRFKYISSVILIIFIISIIGCKKDQATTPIVTAGVHGAVWLNTEDGQWPSNRSGITVSVEGTQLACQTDTSGKFSLTGIEIGNRVLVFSKSGYGIMKTEVSLEQSGNYSILDVNLCQLPTFKVQNLRVSFDSTMNVYGIIGTISKVFSKWQGAVLYAYTDSTVSSDTSKYLMVWQNGIAQDSSTFKNGFSYGDLEAQGFPAHHKVYFVAYGTAELCPHYWDSRIKKSVYTTLSAQPSNVVSITIP